jgi:predicted phage terminase large subunit-like protein
MGARNVTPILQGGAQTLETSERSELIQLYEHYKAMGNEWLKRQIIQNNRIDILATAVLNYHMEPLHYALLRYQFIHPDNLQLVFRGAGKTTIATIAKVIHLLLKNPNLRILLASKTAPNAQAFLKEIRGHFESNDLLADIFGQYYDPHLVNKWDSSEIEVLPRTTHTKEASITCVGVDGTIVSKHYDVIIGDDLVDEDNSRTEYMREKAKTWYYKTLEPTLEPPDPDVPHRGEYHRLGTRYHYADLYGHLIENELANHHQIIPALKDGRSPWPKKYPPEWFEAKRKKMGIIIFNSQYQCDTEAMKGEIFQYDDCQVIDGKDIPSDLKIYSGTDLAISQKDTADHFAHVVIGEDSSGNIYIIDWLEGQFRFNKQTKKIIKYYNKWDPIRSGIEINAYQEAQYQNLKDKDKDIRLTPITANKDKITNAWKMSALFEEHRIFFKKTGDYQLKIEQMVLFPNYRYKDWFDALHLALKARKRRQRKPRSEPKLY